LGGVCFDLPGVPTYHTRPMSQDWSRRRDIDLLADERVCLDFVIPLAELPRLRAQLAQDQGSASGRVCFERVQGTPVAELSVSARVTLACQRCLVPADYMLDCDGRVAMVADGLEAERAPAGLETILAPERRMSVRDLVEEELLLALPLVPLHEGPHCASADARPSGAATGEPRGAEQRQRPFERLGELLKRGRSAQD
jgi:uncharacterized protein